MLVVICRTVPAPYRVLRGTIPVVTQLLGTHVCITGGSSGIGLALAKRCVERGAAVSIIARDADRLTCARDAIAGLRRGARVASGCADVADRDALHAAMASVTGEFGPIDVLVTCAGYARPGRFVDLSDDVFRHQMEVDYFGTLHAVRAVLPSMLDRRRGHVLLVASTAALVGVYGYTAYAPAKFAVRGLAETLRPECRPYGVVVACAYPPDTDTPGLAAEYAHKPEATKRISASITPRTAEAVAEAMVRGIERDRRIVTADATTAALARGAGLVAPVLHRYLDRHVPDA